MIEALLKSGWDYHDSESERLAGELESVVLEDVSEEQAGELLRLGIHTMGEHLCDWPRARALAEKVCSEVSVPDSNPAWLSLSIARTMDDDHHGARAAAMRYICGAPDQSYGRELMLNARLVGTLVGSGRFDEAAALYDVLLEVAGNCDEAQISDRSLAVTSNNLAMDLLEKPGRDAVQDKLMCTAAEAGLTFWRKAGTWENEERAFYGLALVHNAIGAFDKALGYCDDALRIIEANGGEDIDEAFVRLAASQAHRNLGDPQSSEACLNRADEISASWTDKGLTDWYAGERKKAISA